MRRHEIVAQDFLAHLADDTSKITITRDRIKYDRRYKAIVVKDDDQILREYWPPTAENQQRAEAFADGYRMAKVVWGPLHRERRGQCLMCGQERNST